MASTFFEIVCEPYSFHFTNTSSLLGLCFAELFTQLLFVLLAFSFGFSRLMYIYTKRTYKVREKTRGHIFELIFSSVALLIPVVDISYSLIAYYGLNQDISFSWFKYFTTACVFLSWSIAIWIVRAEYTHGLKHNWVLQTFWNFSALLNGLRLQSYLSEDPELTNLGEELIICLALVCSLVLSIHVFISNKPPPRSIHASEKYSLAQFYSSEESAEENEDLLANEKGHLYGKETNTGMNAEFLEYKDQRVKSTIACEEEASWFSRLLFIWMGELLDLGESKQVTPSDLPALHSSQEDDLIMDAFTLEWEKEKLAESPRLIKSILKLFFFEFTSAGLLKFSQNFCTLSGPFILQYIIDFISNESAYLPWMGYFFVLLLFIGRVMETFFQNQYLHIVFRSSGCSNSVMAQTIFAKSLTYDFNSDGAYTLGEITTLVALDTQKIGRAFELFHHLWNAPLLLIAVTVLLWLLVGWAAMGAFIVVACYVPFLFFIHSKNVDLGKRVMKIRDERAQECNITLQGIRTLKFFAWEKRMEKKLEEIRARELTVIRGRVYLSCLADSVIWPIFPMLTTNVTFFLYTVGQGKELLPQVAFSVLALVNVVQTPVKLLPMILSTLSAAYISVDRVQKFLLSKDLQFNIEYDDFMEHRIEISDGTFYWKNKNVLTDINLSIDDELVAIVGDIGSGKTSLVSAIIGEISRKCGNVRVRGSLAYVPQLPWIMNTTVRENILFGRAYDEKRYHQIIVQCQLVDDINSFVLGDMTEIGEKGINLSGGQKQRISMARAIYTDADILILDDPFSALDQHVGTLIFEKLIKKLKRQRKSIILITHQLHILKKCDRIVVLDSGSISEEGAYDELLRRKGPFFVLIDTFITPSESKADESTLAQSTEVALNASSAEVNDQKLQLDGKKKKEGDGKLMTTEKLAKGNIKHDIYLKYFNFMGAFWVALIAFFALGNMICEAFSNIWLSIWSDSYNTTQPINISSVQPQQQLLAAGATNQLLYYFGIYTILGVSSSLCNLLFNLLISSRSIHLSRHVHVNMIRHVLRSPTAFFDSTPVGRIVNRFNSDLESVDEVLPVAIAFAIRVVLQVLNIFAVIAWVSPVFLIFVIPLSFFYRYVQKRYLKTSQQVKRLESASKSPIFSLLTESNDGASTIRSFRRVQDIQTRFQGYVARQHQCFYVSMSLNRWLAIRIELISAFVVLIAGFFAIISKNGKNESGAGLSITYALQLTSILNMMVRAGTDIEAKFISVERCFEFMELPIEKQQSYKPDASWPSLGAISFDHYCLRYRPNQPYALRNITFDIKPREKIAVVGRTGAGKTSLITSLFRIVESEEGTVTIDGEDIAQIKLTHLRSKVGIIPQNPFLFTGTIRSNLDPFNAYSDNALWDVLYTCGIKQQVEEMEHKLEEKISDNGNNLSVGTKQLLCLGRAILTKYKILILDETTANVDYTTDAFIQNSIRSEFKNSTVITIAHRISTILDYDRVLVLDNGEIVEFDAPQNLLLNENSIFSCLANAHK